MTSVAALEQELENPLSRESRFLLLTSNCNNLSRPSSLQQLELFSREAIALEIQSLAPDLLHLVNTQGIQCGMWQMM